jgi:hypothetical protein
MPSKTFLIRGGIATLIIAVILTVQTAWFHNLFRKKKPGSIPLDPNTTIGDVVQKDSNGNGIPDWEEKLWGLDPTKLYTNGVPNETIIRQKLKAAGVAPSGAEPTTSTDRLARDLFALSITLGQNDAVDTSAVQSVADELGSQIALDISASSYSSRDIKTVPTTHASLEAYRNALNATLKKYGPDDPNIAVFVQAVADGDYSNLDALDAASKQYASVAADLRKLAVPVGVASYHLDIMNGFAGMAKSFVYLKDVETDGLSALSGLAVYRNFNALFLNAEDGLSDYFSQYGIL